MTYHLITVPKSTPGMFMKRATESSLKYNYLVRHAYLFNTALSRIAKKINVNTLKYSWEA